MVKEVFHGDDFNASRSALLNCLANYQEQDYQVVKLDAAKIDEVFWQELAKSDSLFGEKKIFVIDNVHAGAKSKKKDELITQLIDLENEIILWDKKKLTALMLKNFPQAKINVFNLKSYLWEFLSALSPDEEQKPKLIRLFREVLKDNDAYYVLIMIA
ncbi:MAG: hypothetical protein LBG64_02880, partial [Pseudomonadales bacterium]|nr:hypothetical protein [Pseudomonadales bacterium]